MMTFKIKKTISAILAATFTVMTCMSFMCLVRADIDQPEIELPSLEEVKAETYCVYDKTAGEIIFSKDPDKIIYPASMTKLMTCQLALDYLDTSATLTVSQNAIDNISYDSTVMGLFVGETTTVSELLYGLMLPSGNDAANVLAEGVIEALLKNYPSDSLTAGPDGINAKYFEDYFGMSSEDILTSYKLSAFAALMNYRAAKLGCTNTHFVNAHGLHDDDHYTTASDLTKIMAAAAENPDFCKLIHTPTHYFAKTNLHTEDGWSIVTNSNKILLDPWLVAKTPEGEDTHAVCVVGGKTGTTSNAGTGMTIYTVNENGHELFTSVCGIPTEYYSYQTRYVASITAYGNFECWNNDPTSVVPGTLGDYQSGNITAAEKPQYDPLYLPGDIAEDIEVPDPATDGDDDGSPDGKDADGHDLVEIDESKGEVKAPLKQELEGPIKWIKKHVVASIIIGVLILLILIFVIALIVKLIGRKRSKRRRKKSKTRPYMGEIIKD
ncbi:MAG: hypothetical protein K6F83_06060 [Clostridiales bacterium]|nr:hypothetical protein [Clostridiales bacterium]